MSTKTGYKVKELFNMLERIKDLVLDITNETYGANVAKKLCLSRRDMEDILKEYADVVHDGNHLMIEKLIYDVTGEVTLFDAPIDLWPKLSTTAFYEIDKAKSDAYLDKMSK
jgi:hypothetical protein